MSKLLGYLNSLPPSEQVAYATRCGTTVGYLRKAVSTKQVIGEGLCIKLDRESNGAVPFDVLRTDVDWDYVRRRDGDSMPAALTADDGRGA